MKYWPNQNKEDNELSYHRNIVDFGYPVDDGAKRYKKWLNKHSGKDRKWIGIPEPELRKPSSHRLYRRGRVPFVMPIYENNNNKRRAMNMVYIMLAVIVLLVVLFMLFFFFGKSR